MNKELAEIIRLETKLAQVEAENALFRKWITEQVESFRQLAIEFSDRYEPCGYYCDESVGHVDHQLFNWAKGLYGNGITYYIPPDAVPGYVPSPPNSRYSRY